MPRPLEVKARSNCRVWIRYDDGKAGEVDLSYLAGRGVFTAWERTGFFESVRIGARGEIAWGDDIDLCPDAVYMRLTGTTPEQLFPNLRETRVGA